MRTLVRNGSLVLIVMAFFLWSIYPPEKKLRLGKDLAGGVSLVYSVQINPGEDEKRVIEQVIQVLQDRVNPTGAQQITMVTQGRDRIEITMPLPSERVKKLRRGYDEALSTLSVAVLDEAKFDRAMAMPADERAVELEKLSGGIAARAEHLVKAAEAYDAFMAASTRYQELAARSEDPNAPPASAEELDAAVQLAGALSEAYDKARSDVLATSLSPEDVRRALSLSDRPITKIDETTNEAIRLPSPRERAMTRIRDGHPDFADRLDEIEAAYARYTAERTTLDDPADLIRLLKGAGVLEFRITVDPAPAEKSHPEEQRLRAELHRDGPKNVQSTDTGWYKINRIESWYNSVQDFKALTNDPIGYFARRGYVVEEYDGELFMLCWNTRGARLTQEEGIWSVSRASRGADELGRPAINFGMDAKGASLLAELTGAHVGDQMAVLLDGEVYTAPNLRSRISKSGQITGDFDQAELDYIIKVLSAGSLQARLSPEPISQSTIGPGMGLDRLRDGLQAGVWALVAVSAFMVFYYFTCGAVAVISLLCNAILILGAMSLARASFTLPGIAGVILTFGMAVDANVLIYERIREESRRGLDLRHALRLGYSKALSAIVDGNVTNLIVCFVLYRTGTQEIKGFAMTLGIGVVCTLFSALVVSRLLMDVLVDGMKWRKLTMLPIVVPVIERILEPKINWLRLRGFFIVLSLIGVTTGLVMVKHQGSQMLDIEFRGGTMVTLRLAKDKATGEPMTLTRQDVEDRLHTIASEVPETSALKKLDRAEVIVVNAMEGGVRSDVFKIKTIVTDQDAVLRSLLTKFDDVLDSLPPLRFRGEDAQGMPAMQVKQVMRGILGEDIDRPRYRNQISDYKGGVAIIIDDLQPRPTLDGLEARLENMRTQPDYSDTLARKREVIVLDGTDDAVRSAVVVVRDDGISFFESEQRWRHELAAREWRLVVDALERTTTTASVSNFSPVIAESFKAQAVVAVLLSFMLIMIYIWVRFGSFRYSAAAIITLLHDVLWVIGLIALAEMLYTNAGTRHIAQALGILPFKIDLNMVAAILTIIGYSLNDTIVIMDRIRENRGKLPYASADVINSSINETISRTVITSGTTLVAVLVLYIFGGEGVRSFSFALMVGIVVGTYSSIAVAAPLVWSSKKTPGAITAEESA